MRTPCRGTGSAGRAVLGACAPLLALAVVVVLTSAPARAVQVDIGPESIVMVAEYKNKPALFPHRRHQGWYGCTACHHVKGQTMTIAKCDSCHNNTMKDLQLDNLRKAAHQLCKDCHTAERAKGRTAAPLQCSVCHVEKAATD